MWRIIIRQSRLEINCIAIQFLPFLDDYEYSPNSLIGQNTLVTIISLASAYRRIENNIDYVDEDLVDRINPHPCIVKKINKGNQD